MNFRYNSSINKNSSFILTFVIAVSLLAIYFCIEVHLVFLDITSFCLLNYYNITVFYKSLDYVDIFSISRLKFAYVLADIAFGLKLYNLQ